METIQKGRIAARTDSNKIREAKAEANKGLEYLNRARDIAEAMTGKKPSTLTAEREVVEHLHDANYPDADIKIRANLKGCAQLYLDFVAAITSAGDKSRYKLSNGVAVLSKKYLERLEDEATLYLEGKQAEMYQAILDLRDTVTELKKEHGIDASKYITLNQRTGEYSVSLQHFLLDTRTR